MLDEEVNVLLVELDWEGLGIDDGFWACPGGGIDDGETAEAALTRELWEELGLVEAEIHSPVWRLIRMFPMTGWDGQTDTCFLVRVRHFEPQPQVDLADENVHGVRWFARSEVDTGAVFFSHGIYLSNSTSSCRGVSHARPVRLQHSITTRLRPAASPIRGYERKLPSLPSAP